jgi:hypothetical protein
MSVAEGKPQTVGKANVVIINSLGREAFQRLFRGNVISDIVVGEEVDWFADQAETIFGTVGISKKEGWNFAIIKPDMAGNFRICERQGNFPRRHTARRELLRQMTGAKGAKAERLAA